MNTEKYMQSALRTFDLSFFPKELTDLQKGLLTVSLGMCGELGELIIAVEYRKDIDRIVKEFGDLEWYYHTACHVINHDPTLRSVSDYRDNTVVQNLKLLTTVVGSFADEVKKHIPQNHPLNQTLLIIALQDINTLLTAIYDRVGIDRATVLATNAAKLLERYPDGFKPSDSIKRVDINPIEDLYTGEQLAATRDALNEPFKGGRTVEEVLGDIYRSDEAIEDRHATGPFIIKSEVTE